MNPIGQSSPAFAHRPFADVLRQVAQDGFQVWEIFGEGEHFLPQQADEFAKLLSSYSVKPQLHLPISDVNIGSLNPRAWELAVRTQEESVAAAARLGISRATIHPGNHSPLSRGHYGKLHEQTRRALHRIERAGREHGVQLCLENMATGWAFETDSMEKLLDLTEGTEYGLCLDIGHASISKRLPEFLDHSDRFANVHIHDNLGVVDDHMTLDEGQVPWREAVRRLLEAGYSGTFVIESRDFDSGRRSQALLKTELQRHS